MGKPIGVKCQWGSWGFDRCQQPAVVLGVHPKVGELWVCADHKRYVEVQGEK